MKALTGSLLLPLRPLMAVSLACQTGSFLGFPLQQAAIMLFAAVCGKSCQNS